MELVRSPTAPPMELLLLALVERSAHPCDLDTIRRVLADLRPGPWADRL